MASDHARRRAMRVAVIDGALAGVDAVIDVTAVQAADAEATRKLFGTATRNFVPNRTTRR
jgi:hypothetical protein